MLRRAAVCFLAAFGVSGCWTWQSHVGIVDPAAPLEEPVLTSGLYCLLEDYHSDGRIDFAAAADFQDCAEIGWNAKAGHHTIAMLDDNDQSVTQPLLAAPLDSGLALLQLGSEAFGGSPGEAFFYVVGVATPNGFAVAPPPEQDAMLDAIAGHPADFSVSTGSMGSVTIDAGAPDAIADLYELTALRSLRDQAAASNLDREGGGLFYVRFDQPDAPPTTAAAQTAVAEMTAALRAIAAASAE